MCSQRSEGRDFSKSLTLSTSFRRSLWFWELVSSCPMQPRGRQLELAPVTVVSVGACCGWGWESELGRATSCLPGDHSLVQRVT